MKARSAVVALLAAACGGGANTGVAPSQSPEMALQGFMEAVADSNLPKMAEYWGTQRGSAAETNNPPDYPRRIEVMRAYLRGFSYRVVASQPSQAGGNIQSMVVELTREECRAQIPFEVVKASNGRWVIQSFDLSAVPSPVRPCPN